MSETKNDYVDTEIVEEKKKKQKRKYTVVKGDTLRKIAGELLCKPNRAHEIREMNKLATDILTVGRVLIIPEK